MNIELQLLGLAGLAIHYLKDWEANHREGKKYDIGKSIPTILLSAITTSVLIYLRDDISNLYVVTPFAALILGYLGNSVFFSFVSAKKPIETTTFGNEFERDSRYYPTKDDFPATGEDGILYYDASTDLYWEWKNGKYIRWVGPRPPKPPKPF